MDDIPNGIKIAILTQELDGIKQQIYRLSVTAEVRKLAGYTDEENRQFITELERLVKMRDAMVSRIEALKSSLSG